MVRREDEEEGEKIAELIGRVLVESIGLDGVSMVRIWSDPREFRGKARAKIV
jgi:hypothetical protein